VSAAADPDVVRQTAREILARPEFGDHRNLLERAIDWIGGQLSDLLDQIAGGVGSGTGFLGSLIQIAVVVGAIALIAYVSRLIFQAATSRRRKPAGDGLVVVFGEKVDPERLAHEAAEAEAAGRWKEAALARYRHLVSALVVAGVLAEIPGRTTGEYRVEYAAIRPKSAPEFARATAMFEQAYYGDAPVGAEQCAEMSSIAAALLPAAMAGTSMAGKL